jgi:hypothetical protein
MSNGAASPLLQFIVQLVSARMDDPTSSLYLPLLVRSQSNPTFDPYQAGGWNLGDLGSGLTASLQDIVVTGLSNAQLAPGTSVSSTDVVSATVQFLTAAEPTPPLSPPLATQITLTGGVTASDDGQEMPPGTFTIAIVSMSAAAQVAITAGTQNNLVATAQSLEISVPTPYTSYVTVTVDIPPSGSFDWGSLLTQSLNQEAQLANLVTTLQGQLGSAPVLAALSQELTAVLAQVAGSS